MSDSFKINLQVVNQLARNFTDPVIRQAILDLPKKRAIAAIIAQAIDDNFNKQGPGWKPLKASTIRQSVSAAKRKKPSTKAEPHRMILQRSGLLKKSVTTPGARGNVYQAVGTLIIYGTDLVYAGIHNRGGVINHPGTDNGFGIKGLKIRPHKIMIPARPFLKLSEFWKNELLHFIFEQYEQILHEKLGGST